MDEASESIAVLVVDDQPDFADLTATHLERIDEAMTVDTATSAQDGLDYLRDHPVDCLVSDYDMPGRDGIEFLQAVREDHPDLPFILFTGKGSEEVASEAISAGVTDYLQKGADTSRYAVLANRIENAVDRHRAQLALEESQQRLSLFFEQSPLGVIQWDESFAVERLNERAEAILGYDEADLVGRSWDVIVPDADRDAVADVVASLLDDAGGYHNVNENVRADGERVICEWHNRVVTDDDGEVVAIFSLFRDVTDRQRRERRFRAIFNNTYTFMGLLEPDGTVLEANERALAFRGLDRADVVGKPVWETAWFQGSDEAEAVAREAVATAAEGDRYRDEIRLQAADGEAIVDFSVRPVRDERGAVTLLVPEGRDVTERERHLRRLETLVENLPGMVYRCTDEPGWPMSEVRGSVESLTGYTPAEVESRAGLWGEEIIHPADRESVRDAVQTALADDAPFEVTYRIRTRDGETKWVWERGRRTGRTDGAAVLEGFITDITDRRETTRQLREERAFVDQALDTLEEAFYVIDADGHIQRWNRRLLELTGYEPEQVDGMDVLEFFHPEHRERVTEAIAAVLRTGESEVRADVLTTDGERVPVVLSGARLTDADGETIGLVGVGRQVAE